MSFLLSVFTAHPPLAFARCALRLPRRFAALGACFDRIVPRTAASSSRRRFVPRRCRLRRPPAPALRGARPAARVSPLVRAFLRNAPALRSAPRRAVVPAPVRAPPPPPSAACCAPLPAAPAAPPPTQSPRRLRPAGLAGVDSPNLDASDWPSRPPGAALGLTPHAAGCRGVPLAPLPCAPRRNRRLQAPRYGWTECMLRVTRPSSRSRAALAAIVAQRYTFEERALHDRSTSAMPRSTIVTRRSSSPSPHIRAVPARQSSPAQTVRSLRGAANRHGTPFAFATSAPI